MRAPLLAVAGPSGAGKSTLAHYLVERNLVRWRPVLLSLDRYYRDLAHLPPREREQNNFDDPEALEWEMLRAHLANLSAGQGIQVPVYDFSTHTRRHPDQALPAGGLIILEGIFALHKKIIDLVDFGVYVELSEEKSLERRLERDTRQRGRAAEDVLRQFRQSVSPMFRLHVLPTREAAHLVVRGDAPLRHSAELVDQLLSQRRQA